MVYRVEVLSINHAPRNGEPVTTWQPVRAGRATYETARLARRFIEETGRHVRAAKYRVVEV